MAAVTEKRYTDFDRGMNFKATRGSDGDVWVDVLFAPDCYVEFVVSPDDRVTFHGLTLGRDHNKGAADPIGGTPITGPLAERLTDIASRA